MKFFKSVFTSFLFLFIFGFSFANDSNCIERELGDYSSICININKLDDNKYTLNTDVVCRDSSNSCAINCNILLPDGSSYRVSCYNGKFQYYQNTIGNIGINIYSSTTDDTPIFFVGRYDFGNGILLDSDWKYMGISSTKELIQVGEWGDLIIETNENYVGEISIDKAEYYDGKGSAIWSTIFPKTRYPNTSNDIFDPYSNRTSDIYFYNYSKEWEDGVINMVESDNGNKIISNFISFIKPGYYKISVKGLRGMSDSLIFMVSGDEDLYNEAGNNENLNSNVGSNGIGNNETGNNENGNDTAGNNIIGGEIAIENNEVNNGDEILNIENSNGEESFVSSTGKVDMSRYEEGNQKQILSNGYSRELNNAYKFAYINKITTMENIELANMNGNLNRISMAKMLSQYAVNILKKNPDVSKKCSFSDVTMQMDGDYSNGVTLACQLGIMGVGMTEFRPSDNVTRAEFGTALSRMLYGTPDGKYEYYSTHLLLLSKLGIINNTDPTLIELRGYVMLMLMRSAK